MPNRDYLAQLKELSPEEKTANISQMAIVLAIKEVSSILERVVDKQHHTDTKLDRQDDKLDEIADALHIFDKRVMRVEEEGLKEVLDIQKTRLDIVERKLDTWITRILTMGTVSVVAWAVLGDTLQNWIGLT